MKARLDILVRNLLPAQGGTLLIASIFLIYFWDSVTHATLWAWGSYVLLATSYRLWFIRHYRQRVEKASGEADIRRLWWLNLLGVVFNGAIWGAAAMLFFHPGDLEEQVLLVCSIAGLTAGAVASLGASRTAVATFMVLVLTPLALEYLSLPGASRGLGILLIFYLGLMLTLAKVVNGYILNSLGLQRQNVFLNDELTERISLLDNAQTRIDTESDMALSVFKALMPRDKLKASNILCQVSSRSSFTADLLLIETRKDGKQTLMLGQFSERGLAASLGAIPVSDIFSSMSRKGFAVDKIATEINRKLHHHLPSNLLLSACFVEIDPIQGQATLWNGGLESVYLLDGEDGTIRQQVVPDQQPLGSLAPDAFDAHVQMIQVAESDQLFMATDGVTRQTNSGGEVFGRERLEAILNETQDIEALNRSLVAALEDFGGGAGRSSDITFVALRTEVAHVDGAETAAAPRAAAVKDVGQAVAARGVPDWGLKLSLQAAAMRRINPVPVLNHIIGEFNGSLDGLTAVELTIGELYKNAVDHGVMHLDSAMKASPEGFAAYYEEREQRLQTLEDGLVEIEINSHATSAGGEIRFSIADSGDGFDVEKLTGMSDGETVHGRGVALAKSLCQEIRFNDKGNRVQGRYSWDAEEGE